MSIPRKRLMDNNNYIHYCGPDLPKKSDVDGPLTIEREKSLSAARVTTDGRLCRRDPDREGLTIRMALNMSRRNIGQKDN